MPEALPLVSIITPSFNQATFLEETIQSVLAQDYPRLEYIVIDGGSTDGSVEIIRRHADRMAYWISERDAGHADALNKGFRRAQGEIIAWLNSDDLYEPGAVRAAALFLIQNPDVGVVYGDRYVIDAQGRILEQTPSPPFSLDTQIAFCIPQESSFFRRSAVEAAGELDCRWHYVFDYDWFLRMLLAGVRFAHVPQVWGRFRLHQTSKTVAGRVPFWRERVAMLDQRLQHPLVRADLAQATLSEITFLTAIELTAAGEFDQAAHYFARAYADGVIPLGDRQRLAWRGLEQLVDAALASPARPEIEVLIEHVLQYTPDDERGRQIRHAIGAVRRYWSAYYYLARAFRAYQAGQFEYVPRDVVRALRHNPRHLFNRGVWAITARAIRIRQSR